MYAVNIEKIATKINPIAFSQYLKYTGWRELKIKKEGIKIFQFLDPSDEVFQVTIPMEDCFSDYVFTMTDAVEKVSFVEGKSTEQLLLYLLNPNADIIKIRLDRKDIEAGSIFMDDAIALCDNAKKLIIASALDVKQPKRYHRGRTADSILKFADNCKFGQTAVGSYIFSVICPFMEIEDDSGFEQLSLFSDENKFANSLTRQVVNKIIGNTSYIKKTIDDGECDKLLEDDDNIISSNFYEALSGLNMNAGDANVELMAEWSPMVKANRQKISRIMLSHDYCEPISGIVKRMRKSADQQKSIVGLIKKLESMPDIDKRTSGKVTIVYVDEGNSDRSQTVTASLSKEEYNAALEAHSKGLYVKLSGEIIGNTNSMKCDSFSVVE